MHNQEVYLTTLEMMHTYGFIKMIGVLWIIPITTIGLIILCKQMNRHRRNI